MAHGTRFRGSIGFRNIRIVLQVNTINIKNEKVNKLLIRGH